MLPFLTFVSLIPPCIGTPYETFFVFAFSPHWLHASHNIFLRLLSKGIRIISQHLKFLSSCSGLSRHLFIEFIISQHNEAGQKISTRIPSEIKFVICPRSTYRHLEARIRMCMFCCSVLGQVHENFETATFPYK